jgi:hypothetical protein
MFARAGGVGVESLDHQIKGRRPDDIQIPVDAGGTPHFIRRSVQISETNVFRHANPASLQELADGKLVNQERIGFVPIEPIAKLRDIDIFAWNERFAPIFFGQATLPIQKRGGPKVVRNSIVQCGGDERGATIPMSMYLIERQLDIVEAVEVRTVSYHAWEVTTETRHTEIRTIKNGVRFFLTGEAKQNTTNGPGTQSRLQLAQLPAIIGEGENLHPKPELPGAALNSFVFPTTDILGSPVSSSTIVGHQRDYVDGSAATAPAAIGHQGTDERIRLVTEFVGDAADAFPQFHTDPRVIPQSPRDAGRSNA